jgi:hypothetical protein
VINSGISIFFIRCVRIEKNDYLKRRENKRKLSLRDSLLNMT